LREQLLGLVLGLVFGRDQFLGRRGHHFGLVKLGRPRLHRHLVLQR
jgi:hypothetical protein